MCYEKEKEEGRTKTKMARPRLYATEEERRAAQRAAWQKYNKAHKQERANHNRQYCQREEVKARRRDMYRERAQQARVEDGGTR